MGTAFVRRFVLFFYHLVFCWR